MSREYSILPTLPLSAHSGYTHPHELPELVLLSSPAQDVVMDLNYMKSVPISPEALLSEALIDMKVNGEHLLLVVNDADEVIGMISSEDILGERTMRFINEKRIPRAEVKVRMIMTPQEEIAVFNEADLKFAKVGDIVHTLHDLKQHDGLVVRIEPESGKQTVIGVLSLSNISKQLGQDVTSDIGNAKTIAELQHGLKH